MSGAIMDYPPEDWLDYKSGQVIDSSRPKAKTRCPHGYLQSHTVRIDGKSQGKCDPVALGVTESE